jgi:hypothetical protein
VHQHSEILSEREGGRLGDTHGDIFAGKMDPHAGDLCRQAKITPCEGGGIQPPLAELIGSEAVHLPRNRFTLVPGCGLVGDSIELFAHNLTPSPV